MAGLWAGDLHWRDAGAGLGRLDYIVVGWVRVSVILNSFQDLPRLGATMEILKQVQDDVYMGRAHPRPWLSSLRCGRAVALASATPRCSRDLLVMFETQER